MILAGRIGDLFDGWESAGQAPPHIDHYRYGEAALEKKNGPPPGWKGPVKSLDSSAFLRRGMELRFRTIGVHHWELYGFDCEGARS
jgi:hypothetical protein